MGVKRDPIPTKPLRFFKYSKFVERNGIMMKSNSIAPILIRPLEINEGVPFELLLLADPSSTMINTYIHDATIAVAVSNEAIVGIYVLSTINFQVAEIKNIAVDPNFQRMGIGKLLLTHAAETAREKGYRKLLIGTANSSTAQLQLYQQLGFDITAIRKHFFTQHYEERLYENGIQCRHMIVLTKKL